MKRNLLFALLAFASLASAGTARALPLPLQNPGFESGPSQIHWQLGTIGPCMSPGNAPTVYDGQAGDPSNVHSGRYSLRYTFNSNKAWQIVPGPVPANATVRVSAWVKMPTGGSPATKVLSLDVQGMNAAGACVWGRTSYPEYGGPFPNWTNLSVSLVAPSAAERVLVNIHTQNGSGCGGICNAPLWVDDVVLEYQEQPTLDLALTAENIHVVQLLDTPDGSLRDRYISQKETMIRVYAQTNGLVGSVPASCRLLYRRRGSGEPWQSMIAFPMTHDLRDAYAADDVVHLRNSFNFPMDDIRNPLPAEATYEFRATLDPENLLPEMNESNNAAEVSATFVISRPVNIAIVANSGALAPQKLSLFGYLRSALPASRWQVRYYTANWPNPIVPQLTLPYLESLREVLQTDMIIGLLDDDYANAAFGGNRVYGLTLAGKDACAVRATSRSYADEFKSYAIHEIGHTLQLPQYGYAGGLGEEYDCAYYYQCFLNPPPSTVLRRPLVSPGNIPVIGGFFGGPECNQAACPASGVEGDATGSLVPYGRAVIFPNANVISSHRLDGSVVSNADGSEPARHSIMGNSYFSWYTDEVLTHFLDQMAPPRTATNLISPPAESTLAVVGLVRQIGNSLLSVLPETSTAAPSEDDPGGNAVLRVSDATGEVLDSLRITVDLGVFPEWPFVRFLEQRSNAFRMELTLGDSVLARMDRTPHAPEVEILTPHAGDVLGQTATVVWDAHDADGDSLTFSILYAPSREEWRVVASGLHGTAVDLPGELVPASSNGCLRVIASDGLNAAASDVADLVVVNKSPQLHILSPGDNTIIHVGDEVELDALAWDPEDGVLPDSLVSWSSSLQGYLGDGRHIVSLRRGTHLMSATVRDLDGALTTTRATVRVFLKPVPWVDDTAAPGVDLMASIYTPAEETVVPRLLLRATPNPTSGHVRFDIESPEAGLVELRVFNIQGRLVSTVFDGVVEAGAYRMDWNRNSDDGRRVPRGIYFARLSRGSATTTLKIALE